MLTSSEVIFVFFWLWKNVIFRAMQHVIWYNGFCISYAYSKFTTVEDWSGAHSLFILFGVCDLVSAHLLAIRIRSRKWPFRSYSTELHILFYTCKSKVNLQKMSGSGKGLLGLWLYRNGSEWQVKCEPSHHPKLADLQTTRPQPETEKEGERISVMFSLKNQVGGLVRVLSVFQDLGINVLHIESRKSVMEVSSVSMVHAMQS